MTRKLIIFIFFFLFASLPIAQDTIKIPVAISAGFSRFNTSINRLFMETANGRRPTLSQGPIIFMADVMIYDEQEGISYASGNLRFADVQQRTFLSAKEGVYYSKEEKVVLHRAPEVLLQGQDNITTRINGTIITVYPNDYYMHVQGNVEINDGETLIVGEDAKIWSEDNRMIVTGNVQSSNGTQVMTTDRLNIQFTNNGLDSYTAIGNVKAVNLEDKMTLMSEYLDYTHTNKFFRAVDNPLIYFYERGTISYANVIEYSTETRMGNLLGDVISIQTNNTQKGYSRWASYDGSANQLRMLGNPRLEQGDSQLIGSEIIVYIDSNRMEILGGGQGFLEQNAQ